MYLTVREAIEVSDKSQTTIHRLCQKYETTKYIKKENNKYLIDKDFLLDKYPKDAKDEDSIDINPSTGENLLKSLTDKNLQITELTLKNKELLQELEIKNNKIAELEEEIFDHQHELAETIDANIHIGKELSAIKDVNELSEIDEIDTSSETKLIITKVTTVTIAVIVLIAFIFMMYYFTK